MKRLAPAPGQSGTVLAGVKAKPSGWPPASLDPGCGRRSFAADGSKPETKIHKFQLSTVRGDCRKGISATWALEIQLPVVSS
jgi:hypothetical protein